MRWAALLVAALSAACGGYHAIDAAQTPPIDAAIPDAIPDADPPDAAMADCTPQSGTAPTRRLIATVNGLATLVTAPPDDPRLFVLEQSGAIRLIVDEQLLPTPFLDLSPDAGGPVVSGGELGLLGLAFHPRYRENRTFYVYYTEMRDTRWAERVIEYQASATDPNVADPATARVLLDLPDGKSNHNAGMLEFGPDEYLYISTGDGGGQGDPLENSQNKDSLFGKILRIDVDARTGTKPYGIPADNPYATAGGAPEVYMYGLRNPWRFSFDRANGDIYVGDVGGGVVEEIDVVPRAMQPGADFGWDDCEGTTDFEATGCAAPTTGSRVRPLVEHLHADTPSFQAIIGGVVYRGRCFPDVGGRYFYTDFYAGGLWSFVYSNGQATDPQVVQRLQGFPTVVASLHTDGFGEMYLTYRDGTVYRLEFH